MKKLTALIFFFASRFLCATDAFPIVCKISYLSNGTEVGSVAQDGIPGAPVALSDDAYNYLADYHGGSLSSYIINRKDGNLEGSITSSNNVVEQHTTENRSTQTVDVDFSCHLDVKPAPLIVTSETGPILLDGGVATFSVSGGTPPYTISPPPYWDRTDMIFPATLANPGGSFTFTDPAEIPAGISLVPCSGVPNHLCAAAEIYVTDQSDIPQTTTSKVEIIIR